MTLTSVTPKELRDGDKVNVWFWENEDPDDDNGGYHPGTVRTDARRLFIDYEDSDEEWVSDVETRAQNKNDSTDLILRIAKGKGKAAAVGPTVAAAGSSGAAPIPSADFAWGEDDNARAVQLEALIELMAKSSRMLSQISLKHPLTDEKDARKFEAACRVQRCARERLVALSSVLKGENPKKRRSSRGGKK